jgi:divalent metal cation (Fe/Co/Zn/Cd) transporter
VLSALRVDCRNDALLGAASVLGFWIAKWTGWMSLDSWLALPIALWIAFAGFRLAAESIGLLMGIAPPSERQEELKGLTSATAGVLGVTGFKARSDGASLNVWIEIRVAPETSLRSAQEIAESAQRRLLAEADVTAAMVHINVK